MTSRAPVSAKNLMQCPRCGESHPEVSFKPLRFTTAEGYTHWGACPSSGDPIFFGQVRSGMPLGFVGPRRADYEPAPLATDVVAKETQVGTIGVCGRCFGMKFLADGRCERCHV